MGCCEPDAFIWLTDRMKTHGVALWGVADLRSFSTPADGFPFAVSLVFPMTPSIMAGIRSGPNQAYADEYAAVNRRIDQVCAALADEIGGMGLRSKPLAASERTDKAGVRGDFPHKTAATRAGLGWIGRHCQLITRPYGPWVRLGTVFTDMNLPYATPVEKNRCGRCMLCVEACPAGALKGAAWHPGVPREDLLDAKLCDEWKKEHYFEYHGGHNCGICSAACPCGLKVLRRKSGHT